MRVMVTGANGLIGAELVRVLVEGGHEVVAVVRSPERSSRLALLRDRIRLEPLALEDGTSAASLLRASSPEVLFHLAWYAHPRDYLTSHANLDSLSATTSFARIALAGGCRKLIAVGSCLEYAPSERLRREDDALDPSSLYASCKMSASLVLRALARAAGADFAWARVFHLHGPTESAERLIPAVANRIRQGEPIDLSPGEQVRDHLHVGDVAAGLSALIHPDARGAYNICSGEPVTLKRVLLTVADALGGRHLLRFGGRAYRPDEVMFLAGDPGRLRALGWRPGRTLEDGLRDAIGAADNP
jgi:nucleoside-diphosphate-sugar epimerase